jgi:hypothetical protein
MRAVRFLVRALIVAGVLALCVWVGLTHVAPSYDGLYALAWGQELAHGHDPDLIHPLAPFAHPLPIMASAAFSTFGPMTAFDIVSVLAVLSFALLGVAGFRLTRVLAGSRPPDLAVAAGFLAFALIVTRARIDFFALAATIDVPFAALVLLAFSFILQTPRTRPWLPLSLLVAAGLLRPEAWVLGFLYCGWLFHAGLRGMRLLGCLLLAVAPVALWLGFAWALSGSPWTPLTGNPEAVSIASVGFEAPPGGPVYVSGLDTLLDHAVDGVRSILGDELAIAGLVAMAASLCSLLFARGAQATRFALVTGFIAVLIAQTVVLAQIGAPLPDRYVLTAAVALVALTVAWLWLLPAPWALGATLALMLAALTGALSGDAPHRPFLPKVRAEFRDSAKARQDEQDLYELATDKRARAASLACGDINAGGGGGPHFVAYAKPLVAHALEIGPQRVDLSAAPRAERHSSSFMRNLKPNAFIYEIVGDWAFQSRKCLK